MKKQTFSSKQPMLICDHNLNRSISKIVIVFAIMATSFYNVKAQVKSSSELFKTIKKLDGILFNNGFNKCMLSEMKPYISDDLEFYHDQGGLTTTKKEFFSAISQNICSNKEKKPIRKLVQSSLEVFPLYENGVLYGAIQNGVHEFYIKERNKDLYVTSTAKFTHVWVKDTNNWKLKRVLSYDHQLPMHKKTTLFETILMEYVGEYRAVNTGEISITKKGNGLEINAGKMRLEVHPKTETLFFNKEAPLTFEFVKDSKGNATNMIIRENGNIVETAERIQ